jgi:small subunit ribosomal protein S6
MRRYETIAIIDPDLSDEERAGVLEKTTELIPKEGGFLIMLDEWGNKKLSYEKKKKGRGYYVRIDYCGMGPLVDEIERSFRIDDKVLKFMTVLLEKDADIENIRDEMAKAKSEAEAEAARKKAEEAEAEANSKKAEEAEKEAEATDEVPDNDSDADPIPSDSPETETVETKTTKTEINKEEQ